jgi:TonB family protein
MKRMLCGVGLLAASLGLRSETHVAAAQEQPAPTVSPGRLALLAESTDRATVEQRLAEALVDPRAEVRAAAARVTHAKGLRSLDTRLQAALEAETEPMVARELIRALATAASPGVDEKLIEAARRLGPPLGGVVAEALGRIHGTLAYKHLPALRSLELSKADWAGFVRGSTEVGEPFEQLARQALRQPDPPIWAATLWVALEAGYGLTDETLMEALNADGAAIRDETAWHLVALATEGGKLSPALRSAVDVVPGSADAGLAGHELLRRAIGKPPVEQRAWVEALRAGDPEARARAWNIVANDPLIQLLTAVEREAVAWATLGDPKALSERKSRRPVGKPATAPAPTLPVRTLDDFPRGFLSDLMAVSGCSPEPDAVGVAAITYGAAERPQSIALANSALPERCQPAVRAMFLSSILPRGDRLGADRKQIVVAALDRQVIASFDEVAPSPPRRHDSTQRVGSSVEDPRKLQHVSPQYPDKAERQRVQGTVILRAEIAASGTVRTVRTLVSVEPSLDVSAVRAVSRWRYTPTLSNGVAVPVVMTVTVNFRQN